MPPALSPCAVPTGQPTHQPSNAQAPVMSTCPVPVGLPTPGQPAISWCPVPGQSCALSVQPGTPSTPLPTEDAEVLARKDPYLSQQNQQVRRSKKGLSGAEASLFAESHEFVSLGCFCAVAHALKSLGIGRLTYPFDWNRSPIEGVIQLLENGFADFLTYSISREEEGKGKLYGGTAWRGSFWHHDITKQKTKDDFRRRIDRFHGRGEIAATKPRVFVRAVNSTKELELVPKLLQALRDALPHARVKLLVLVDLQTVSSVMRVKEVDDVLFARVHESVFADRMTWSIEKQSEAYADAISQAVLMWAGSADAERKVGEVPTLRDFQILSEPFYGGNTEDDLFAPQRIVRAVWSERSCARSPSPVRRDVSPLVKGSWVPRTPSPRRSGSSSSPPAPCSFQWSHGPGKTQ